MLKNRRKYCECLAGIMQKAGFVNKECLVKILLHCFFPELMYGTCCTFGMIQNMLKIDKFQQLIAHLFLKSDCNYDLCNLYNIDIHMCTAEIKQKLQKLYN